MFGKNVSLEAHAFRATIIIGGASLAFLLIANAPADNSDAAPQTLAPVSLDPEVQRQVFRNGHAGFVVTDIAYALGPDGKDGACPNGMTGGVRALVEAFSKTPAGQRKDGEATGSYESRLVTAVNTAPNGQNICMRPEASAPDPSWRMVSGGGLRVDGIDLDGRDSSPTKRPAAGTCAHQDFQGLRGERGIDNQLYRVVGCTTSFQSGGQANSWQIEMYTGSWGILLSLDGVDDLRNDPEVTVGIYANGDPIQLSAARTALPFATYAMYSDPRYRARSRGRIVNGVLTTDPVDVRLINVTNSMIEDRTLRDARLRLTFNADGGMEGILGGYTPVENMYDLQYGSRYGRDARGQLASERLRVGTAVGRASVSGHSCNGGYYALKQAADGHPDANGRCTSISTQYRIRIAPAFVVDAKTQSINSPLAVK